jgi:hypothetical protein
MYQNSSALDALLHVNFNCLSTLITLGFILDKFPKGVICFLCNIQSTTISNWIKGVLSILPLIIYLSIPQVSSKPSLIYDLSVTPLPNGIFFHISTNSMN